MMKTLLTILLTAITVLSFAQTDIIEMKSRNASLKKYERISKIKSYDHVASNFGMLRDPMVRNAVLDSVKAISDSVAIMYTSNYCTRQYSLEPDFKEFYIDSNGTRQRLDEPIRQYPNRRIGNLWEPGADTVFDHPLFSHRHALDSIKEEIDNRYFFNLPSDSISFIGFDNSAGISNKDAIQPVKQKREQQKNDFGWELIFMIITPIVFLLGMNKLILPRTTN